MWCFILQSSGSETFWKIKIRILQLAQHHFQSMESKLAHVWSNSNRYKWFRHFDKDCLINPNLFPKSESDQHSLQGDDDFSVCHCHISVLFGKNCRLQSRQCAPVVGIGTPPPLYPHTSVPTPLWSGGGHTCTLVSGSVWYRWSRIIPALASVSVSGLGALLNKRFVRQSCGNFAQRHLTSMITSLWGQSPSRPCYILFYTSFNWCRTRHILAANRKNLFNSWIPLIILIVLSNYTMGKSYPTTHIATNKSSATSERASEFW